MPSRLLIEPLGGVDGVRAAVTGLYARLLDDDVVAPYFDDVDLSRLRAHMADFLVAALTGAESGYAGRPMAEAHRGLEITDEAFDHVVEHLVAVLDEAGIGSDVVDEVVGLLAPLRSQVVY